MGLTRRRLLSQIGLIVFFSFPVFGNWNQEFLSSSAILQSYIPPFQQKYRYLLEEFDRLGKQIESDFILSEEIKKYGARDKINFFDPKKIYVLKKRPLNNISEVYFWELAIILGLDAYVSPSFPLEIEGKKVVIQKMENLTIGSTIQNLLPQFTDKVSLKHYWQAHLLAFLLGACDLSGQNIGISPEGLIRLFDNECSFFAYSEPLRTENSFSVPFMSVAFDWSQYNTKIDEKLASDLTAFIEGLETKMTHIQLYGIIRQFDTHSIVARMEILKKFKVKEKTTFFDFICFLYPHLSQGLDELSHITSVILRRKVGHGIALFFTTSLLKKWHVLPKDLEEVKKWVNQYIPDFKQA